MEVGIPGEGVLAPREGVEGSRKADQEGEEAVVVVPSPGEGEVERTSSRSMNDVDSPTTCFEMPLSRAAIKRGWDRESWTQSDA